MYDIRKDLVATKRGEQTALLSSQKDNLYLV